MAIDVHQFRQILNSKVKGKALSAAFPDLLIAREDILLPDEFCVVRQDTEELQGHHSWGLPIYDTRKVFAGLGLELDVIDREAIEGSERIVDLNIASDLGEFDLVIDPGTSEHCFNIAQVAINLANAVKVGGFISQAIPMSMFNHGYYNLNPKWFLDFYPQNGFEIVDFGLRHSGGIYGPLLRDARYCGVSENAVLTCLAKRKEIKPFIFPYDVTSA